MKKYGIPIFILALPAVIYLVLFNTSTIYKPLPFKGPRHGVDPVTNDSIYHTIGVWEMLDMESGDTISSDQFDGKLRVVYFFHPKADFELPMAANIKEKVQKAIYQANEVVVQEVTDNVKVIAICVKHDWSTEEYEEYKEKLGPKPFWTFYSMNASPYKDVLETSFCFDPIPFGMLEKTGLPFFFLVDGNNHVRGIYNARKVKQTEELQQALHVLLREEIVPLKNAPAP